MLPQEVCLFFSSQASLRQPSLQLQPKVKKRHTLHPAALHSCFTKNLSLFEFHISVIFCLEMLPFQFPDVSIAGLQPISSFHAKSAWALGARWALRVFFPTCQVRVSRFYQNCFLLLPSLLPSFLPSFLPDLNCKLQISVGTARPQHGSAH